jgi:hypothetical protein
MTERKSEPAGLFDRPCIATFTSDVRHFTVSEYDTLQRQRFDRPLWARVVPRVEHLTTEPGRYDVRITDQEAYDAQMWALIGLPDLAARRSRRLPRPAL